MNYASYIVAAIVTVLAVLVIIKLIRDRKKGKSSCPYGCENCSQNGDCKK